MSAASYEDGPEPAAAPCLAEGVAAAVLQRPGGLKRASHAQRMREARANLRTASERDYVQAIDRWLDGGAWEGGGRYFTTGPGLTVRLMEERDALTQDGVPVVSRSPIRLPDLPTGTRTSARLEARTLASVAVRGDAGWYDGEPRKVREGGALMWNGLSYAQLRQ